MKRWFLTLAMPTLLMTSFVPMALAEPGSGLHRQNDQDVQPLQVIGNDDRVRANPADPRIAAIEVRFF